MVLASAAWAWRILQSLVKSCRRASPWHCAAWPHSSSKGTSTFLLGVQSVWANRKNVGSNEVLWTVDWANRNNVGSNEVLWTVAGPIEKMWVETRFSGLCLAQHWGLWCNIRYVLLCCYWSSSYFYNTCVYTKVPCSVCNCKQALLLSVGLALAVSIMYSLLWFDSLEKNNQVRRLCLCTKEVVSARACANQFLPNSSSGIALFGMKRV